MRSTRLITIMMALFAVCAAAVFADESDSRQSIVGGTIGSVGQLDIASDFIWDLAADGSGESQFDTGYTESTDTQTTLVISANMAWQLQVNYNGTGWSCPDGYDKPEADLLLRVTNAPTGTIMNGYNSYRSPPAAASRESMLEHDAGVAGDLTEIQYKVLLDWTRDIPGSYSITLTYTLITGTLE